MLIKRFCSILFVQKNTKNIIGCLTFNLTNKKMKGHRKINILLLVVVSRTWTNVRLCSYKFKQKKFRIKKQTRPFITLLSMQEIDDFIHEQITTKLVVSMDMKFMRIDAHSVYSKHSYSNTFGDLTACFVKTKKKITKEMKA